MSKSSIYLHLLPSSFARIYIDGASPQKKLSHVSPADTRQPSR